MIRDPEYVHPELLKRRVRLFSIDVPDLSCFSGPHFVSAFDNCHTIVNLWRCVYDISKGDKNISGTCTRATCRIVHTWSVSLIGWSERIETDEIVVGNLPEIFQSQVGAADFKYQKEYGDIVRIKGPFGVRPHAIKQLRRLAHDSFRKTAS